MTRSRGFTCVLILTAVRLFFSWPVLAEEPDGADQETGVSKEADVSKETGVSEKAAAETSPAGTAESAGETAAPAGARTDTAPVHRASPANVTQNIENAISRDTHTMGVSARFGIALAVVAGQALLIWIIWLLFKVFAKKVIEYGSEKIKPLTIKKLKLLNTKQILNILLFLLKILKYLITAFQLFITIPIVFSLFPPTKDLASTIFSYILNPLKNIFFGTIRY
ncbi:MAG: hypothetical protein LBG10_08935, partial [Treponema sp.]|nr:hypothetical protein [Treponema sp.]